MNKQLVRKALKIALLLTVNWFFQPTILAQMQDSAITEYTEPTGDEKPIIDSPTHDTDKTVAVNIRDTRQLSTANPVLSESQTEVMQSPLQFVSPSIRAFEPEEFSIPQEQIEKEPRQIPIISTERARGRTSREPITPMKAPLAFISPSIQAFTYIASLAKEKRKTPFNYDISGYIKNEAFIDSYQVLGLRQDQYLIVPLPPKPDRCGNNINSHGRFNMLAIESRVRGEVSGPYVFGAQTYAVIEVDAWAKSDLQMGLLRIRHAFMYFEWKDKSLLMGQYWHPLLLPECFADTISFDGGTPFDPFAREPQVRLTKQFDNMTFILAFGALPTSPFDGPGPAGVDSVYARNGLLPNINVQLFSSIRKHLCGIGFDVSRIVPRLVTDKNFRMTESLISFIAFAFSSFNWERLGLRTKFIYAQNGNPFGLISGYAVESIDPYTDKRKYANIQCVNAWLDTAYKGDVEPGLFLGVSKNIGASKKIIPSYIYSDFSKEIDLVYRVQPRIRWFYKPFIFGAELELTGVKYGTPTDTGRVINTKLVNNFRVLLAAFYVF